MSWMRMWWTRIGGCSAAGAAGAARRTIGWWCATCAGRDLGSCWCWCWHSRWRCRWWCCRCGQCRWFQLDATWQCTAPLACRQAGKQAWSLHSVARRATDLRLGAIVGAIGCTDDRVVVVTRQRVALNNCRGGREDRRSGLAIGIELYLASTYSHNVAAVHSSAHQSHR